MDRVNKDVTVPEVVAQSAPRHVAIIMDGNGRWAGKQGLARIEGHKAGARSVRCIVEECCRVGVRYLTLFSFSTENWNRSTEEVGGLMELFRQYLESELGTMMENGVRLRAIGDLERLPLVVRTLLKRDIEKSKENTRLDLVLAVSYGGREEIVATCKRLCSEVQKGKLSVQDITPELFAASLWTKDIPDPDLLIRTSGEERISNFLLYQLAYSEIVITPEYWPDFDAAAFGRALAEYASRERRFGLTAEQIRELRNGSGAAHNS